MRLMLAPLSTSESRIVLSILNLNPRKADTGEFLKTAMSLEETANIYAQKVGRPAKIKGNIWRYYFKEADPDEARIQSIRREWKESCEDMRNGIAQRAGWFSLPWLALPGKVTVPAITSPRDLTIWFLTRLVANRQARFFVKCSLCGRFAIRHRSSAKYCGPKCQELAKVAAVYKKRGADFSQWLLAQPKDRVLPPVMDLKRSLARQTKYRQSQYGTIP